MNYAIVENGKVTNVIIAQKDFAEKIGAINIEGSPVGIGWNYTDGIFSHEVTDYDEEGKGIGTHTESWQAEEPAPELTLEERVEALEVTTTELEALEVERMMNEFNA